VFKGVIKGAEGNSVNWTKPTFFNFRSHNILVDENIVEMNASLFHLGDALQGRLKYN
jgi:hypothetical protein